MRKIVNDRVFEPAPAMHRFGSFSVVMPDGDRIQFIPERTVHANPRGKRVLVEDAADYGVAWGCQLFVGLSVDGRPRWSEAHVRDLAADIRSQQLQGMVEAGMISEETEHGLSVTPQLGYWAKIGADGRERSVSVTIMSLSGENQEEFFAHMSELAATLAVELEQDSVVYQIFHGGIVKFVGARRTVKR